MRLSDFMIRFMSSKIKMSSYIDLSGFEYLKRSFGEIDKIKHNVLCLYSMIIVDKFNQNVDQIDIFWPHMFCLEQPCSI